MPESSARRRSRPPAERHEPKKVFIGSTYEDLKEYREAAIHVCRRLGWVAFAMEEFGPDSRQSLTVCLEHVDQADIYVGLFAHRYGFIPKGETRSITELEYEHARERGIPILAFVVDEKTPWPADQRDRGKKAQKLRGLKKRLGERHTFRKLGGVESFRLDLGICLPRAGTPQPTYASEHTRQVSEALEEAWRRHEELTLNGGDTSGVLKEILDLKRQLRAGPDLEAGDILGGRYRLLEHLGRGGFATVWRAYDRERHKMVAVKVLHGQYSKDQTRRERFFRGARKMVQVSHPGIVRVFDEHCEDDGFHYFVMEYVGGGDLRKAVLGKQLGPEKALAKVLEVGEALEQAHRKKLIHRDVKPANILLDGAGRPKLTDFDLVRAFDSTGGTRTQAGLGTYLYMAPEAMGHAKEADVRADVYSLAMTAAFALHGEELPSSVLRDHERFLKSLRCGKAVKAALLKATAIEPEDRFPTVVEFLAALRAPEVEPPKIKVPRAEAPSQKTKTKRPATRPSRNLVEWVEKEVPRLSKAKRWAAVLKGVEQALPVETEDLKSVGILAWALDYFVGRSESAAKRAQAKDLQQALLEPLRKLCPPPPEGGKGWVEISGGSFPMGSEKGHGDERPVHEVIVSPFSMLDHPVTSRELQRLIERKRGGDELPAVDINWYHAYAYAAWLGGRLPTEAEWEYACRAGTTTEYWSGDEEADLARVGWYSKNSGNRLHPVEEKEANPRGVYDMHGNVWEWTADWYARYPEEPQTNPWGPPSGEWRVFRGGSYWLDAVDARSAVRDFGYPGSAWHDRGFRVVVPVAPGSALPPPFTPDDGRHR